MAGYMEPVLEKQILADCWVLTVYGVFHTLDSPTTMTCRKCPTAAEICNQAIYKADYRRRYRQGNCA